jgi:hypothetical protein
MATQIPTDPRECLGRALDVIERLRAEGREAEALEYLRESILPALEELALRAATAPERTERPYRERQERK